MQPGTTTLSQLDVGRGAAPGMNRAPQGRSRQAGPPPSPFFGGVIQLLRKAPGGAPGGGTGDGARGQVKTQAFWSVALDALDLAATIPPQTEVIFALQQRGFGTLECLSTLQDAPSLSMSDSAAMDVAACLAQPFVLEEGNAEFMRETATETHEQTQSVVAIRYAKEVAAAKQDEQRRRLQRRRSLDDTDLHMLGLLEIDRKSKLAEFTSPSTKRMIATIHSLSMDRNRLQLTTVKEALGTDTLDYLLSTDDAAARTLDL